MTPVMLDKNQFVISFNKSMTSIQVTNPHKPGEFDDFQHTTIKALLDKAIKSIENDPLSKDLAIPTVISLTKESDTSVAGSVTYREVLEIDAQYKKLEALGMDLSDNGFYKAIKLVVAKFQKEVESISEAHQKA